MDTKTVEMGETVETIHVFERAGLGLAPFRFGGYERMTYQACPGAPVQPGGCCDFCGTAIIDAFWIKSSDGRKFKVGSDCVYKTGDAGLRRVVAAEVKAAQARARASLAERKAAELSDLLADPAVQAKLAAMPHTRGWSDRSFLDECEWFAANAGAKGRASILKAIKGRLAEG